MSIDAMPDRRLPFAWHIRGIPSTHLGPCHAGRDPLQLDMPRKESTLCNKRGGPQWVPGTNPGALRWCADCRRVWDTMDRMLGNEAEKIRYEDYQGDIPRET